MPSRLPAITLLTLLFSIASHPSAPLNANPNESTQSFIKMEAYRLYESLKPEPLFNVTRLDELQLAKYEMYLGKVRQAEATLRQISDKLCQTPTYHLLDDLTLIAKQRSISLDAIDILGQQTGAMKVAESGMSYDFPKIQKRKLKQFKAGEVQSEVAKDGSMSFRVRVPLKKLHYKYQLGQTHIREILDNHGQNVYPLSSKFKLPPIHRHWYASSSIFRLDIKEKFPRKLSIRKIRGYYTLIEYQEFRHIYISDLTEYPDTPTKLKSTLERDQIFLDELGVKGRYAKGKPGDEYANYFYVDVPNRFYRSRRTQIMYRNSTDTTPKYNNDQIIFKKKKIWRSSAFLKFGLLLKYRLFEQPFEIDI